MFFRITDVENHAFSTFPLSSIVVSLTTDAIQSINEIYRGGCIATIVLYNIPDNNSFYALLSNAMSYTSKEIEIRH